MAAFTPILSLDGGINRHIQAAKYAVRGELYQTAKQMNQDGKPVVFTNIGNPQALGQKPLTFPRQVLSLLTYPELMDNADICKHFPSDAVTRARKYQKGFPGGTGAYQDSMGNAVVRQEVADFLEQRDGEAVDISNLYLTNGASSGISSVMNLLIRDSNDAVLLPVPQYPLYSATLSALNGTKLNYFLNEEKDWGLDWEQLESAVAQAKKDNLTVRAFVIINPGNPTGQMLTYEDQKRALEFCRRERIVLIADEVYQANVYVDGQKFTSFRKVYNDFSAEDRKGLEIFSFHSVSKGVFGECGRRGGFFEVTGVSDDVKAEITKTMSMQLCSNVDGMIMVGLMVNPPKEGDASFESFQKEYNGLLESLKRRSVLVAKTLNDAPGIECNTIQGALYAFPTVHIPAKAQEAAKAEGRDPTVFYCLKLLKDTGICCVPGSGFGQKDGTHHFRTTILPQEDVLEDVLKRFATFQTQFMKEFS